LFIALLEQKHNITTHIVTMIH